MPLDTTSRTTGRGAPQVVFDAAQVDRLEALAVGAMQHAPELADRLLGELSRGKIVATAHLPSNVVAIGSEVTYRDKSTEREQTVVLVLPRDADIARQRASVLTPIGVALIGLTEGAEFSWKTRDGQSRRLTVTRVRPAPATITKG